VLPRPFFRLPLWSIPLIVAGLYAARSLLRGSWRAELPMDLVVVVLVLVVMATVGRLRAVNSEDAHDSPAGRGASHDDVEGPTN
jgi:hypothetical protein